MALDGARAGRHRGPRRGDPDAPPGVGGERPRGGVHGPARRVPELPPPVPRGQSRDPGRPVPGLRHEGRLRRAADVQPDVQDVHGAGRGRGGDGLPAAGDGAGDLREFPERADCVAAADPVWDRADREGVPQTITPGNLSSDARVRADGDAVRVEPGTDEEWFEYWKARRMEWVVSLGIRPESSASMPMRRRSWRTTRRRHSTSSTNSCWHRVRGDPQPDGLRPEPAPGVLGEAARAWDPVDRDRRYILTWIETSAARTA